MNTRTRTDVLLLVAFCGFLFFYGLGAFGLLGADEPRYAQVAREMLDRHDWITPTLQGKPWMEKPVLYYWQAMVGYSVFGVSDRAARLPGALDAALMIAAIYFFLRRFRPGLETDGSLIAASCAGIIGFARGASTDMPLAAMFAIALLGWYSWYESKKRPGLIVFYSFLALATLAKGPVAIFFAGAILLIFLAIKRDWGAIRESLWIPGIASFLAVAMPWYVAVQLRNRIERQVLILERVYEFVGNGHTQHIRRRHRRSGAAAYHIQNFRSRVVVTDHLFGEQREEKIPEFQGIRQEPEELVGALFAGQFQRRLVFIELPFEEGAEFVLCAGLNLGGCLELEPRGLFHEGNGLRDLGSVRTGRGRLVGRARHQQQQGGNRKE